MIDGREEEASVDAQTCVDAHAVVLEEVAVAVGADLAQHELVLVFVVDEANFVTYGRDYLVGCCLHSQLDCRVRVIGKVDLSTHRNEYLL